MTTRVAEEDVGEAVTTPEKSRGLATFVLAAFAAAAAMVALVVALGAKGGRAESGIPDRTANTNLPAVTERDVRSIASEQVKADLRETKEQWSAGIAQLERWKNEMLETIAEASKKADAVSKGIEGRVEVFEEQGRSIGSSAKDLADLKQALKDLAAVVKELKDRPVVVAQAPTATAPTGPTPAEPPPTPSSGPTPEEIAANKEKAKQALQDLSSDDAMKVFSATIVLGRHGSLEAVEPLAKVLKEHKDMYPRMGAANALQLLKACDAVPALIDALLDKESNVFVSASKALISITAISEKELTELNLVVASDTSKQRRNEAKAKWVSWWRQHEEEVRTRLNQPGKAGGTPPAPAQDPVK